MSTVTLPPGSAQTEGRARLLIMRTAINGAQTRGIMVLVDPQGNILFQGNINSGGARDSRGALPGLNIAGDRAIIAEYGVSNRRDRPEPGYTYSNGTAGYSYNLDNAPNMAAINGQGRGDFRIHTGGLNPENHGCVEFVDANDRSSAQSDATARAFDNAMRSLGARAPRVAEIVNPNMAPGLVTLSGRPASTASESPAPQNTTLSPAEAAEEAERRRRFETEANNIQRSNDPFTALFLNLLRMFLPPWLADLITLPNDPNAPNEYAADMEEVSTGTRAGYAMNMVRSDVRAAWTRFQGEHPTNGQPVRLSSPARGNTTITSGFGHRERPTAGASRDHKGLDIDSLDGSSPDILAAADGVVLFSGRTRGYGYNVIIGHADGSTTFYGHMTGAEMPTVGTTVARGQKIGIMGTTGVSTGTHLHFEWRKPDARGNMVAVNPVIDGETQSRGDSLRSLNETQLAAARAAAGPLAGQDQTAGARLAMNGQRTTTAIGRANG